MPKITLLPALCIALGLTVCQTYQAPMEVPTVLEEAQASAEQPYGRPVDFDKAGLPAAFADAIETYCKDGTFPDGQKGEIPNSLRYATIDVDGDGQQELILQHTNTFTAAMTERIYAYENGAFRQQLMDFPALTYYDNGIVKAEWSHNQGLAGDRLWPYTLYQYQQENDCYLPLGSVDAWHKNLSPSSKEFGQFPKDIDADGDGCIYLLLRSDWQGQYSQATLVDGPQHESWRNQFLSGAKVLEIPYRELQVEMVYPNALG